MIVLEYTSSVKLLCYVTLLSYFVDVLNLKNELFFRVLLLRNRQLKLVENVYIDILVPIY